MAKTYTRQYRPLATVETSTDDGVSVRLRELATAANNFKYRGLKILTAMWPAANGNDPQFQSTDNDTDEQWIHSFAPVRLPARLDQLHGTLRGYMVAGASGSCTWRLYASGKPYRGPQLFDATYLLPFYSVSSWTISSTTAQIDTFDDGFAVVGLRNYAWFTLTAENSASSEYCLLSNLDLTARLVV